MYIYLKFALSIKKQKRDHIRMDKERCARIKFGMIKLFLRHLGLDRAKYKKRVYKRPGRKIQRKRPRHDLILGVSKKGRKLIINHTKIIHHAL